MGFRVVKRRRLLNFSGFWAIGVVGRGTWNPVRMKEMTFRFGRGDLAGRYCIRLHSTP